MPKYVDMKYVQKNTIEHRDYQASMAQQASSDGNTMIVLPTGLGKTAVALQVAASYLAYIDGDDAPGTKNDSNPPIGAVLFLAPTRVLANQHYDFMLRSLTIDDVSLVTGEDSVSARKRLWNASVVCATPEITRNDLGRGMISPEMFGLVIFDEAHRTVGDYAYSGIAEAIESHNPRILGMTATLPSDIQKATEIMARLRIARVAERGESSPDVVPYIQKTETEWITVELTPVLKQMQSLLRNALKSRCGMLRSCGVSIDDRPSLSALLKLRDYVLEEKRAAANPLFTAIRIHYALSMLEAHGITPFLKFCDRTREKGGKGTLELFEVDPNFTRALATAKSALAQNTAEHPKLAKLRELLADIQGKVLVFTSYRDSVDMICDALNEMGVGVGKLIGKAGDKGLKQKEQVETVRRFRDGEFRVMVATRVGEEGLDIAEVNHVIFYDNVPSSIRYVQRRGRTGRKAAGRLIVLVAKGTIDEAYHWIGRYKTKTARSMGRTMSDLIAMNKNDNNATAAPANNQENDTGKSQTPPGSSPPQAGLDEYLQ